MVHYFVGTHAALGELAAIGFLWIFIELLNKTSKIKRIKIIALISVVLLFLSWISGGWYYVNIYSSNVKPIIKEGPQSWAHSVVTETKEHVFLFLPFLALLTFFMIWKYEKKIVNDKNIRFSLMLLCLFIFLLAMSMGLMGYLISTGARAALEARI